jgi:hypothetical protein
VLDPDSLLALTARFPDIQIFAPLEMCDLLKKWDHSSLVFNWRHHLTFRGVEFVCMPADFGRRLWCSWLIDVLRDLWRGGAAHRRRRRVRRVERDAFAPDGLMA